MRLGVVIPVLMIVACGGSDDRPETGVRAHPTPATSDSAGIELVKYQARDWPAQVTDSAVIDLTIGDGSQGLAPEFGTIAGILSDTSGRIYVLDRSRRRIFVFDSLGVFQRAFGHEGEGPGEFGNGLSALLPRPGDSLATFDESRREWLVFSAAGEWSRSFSLPLATGIPIRTGSGRRGPILAQFRKIPAGREAVSDSLELLAHLGTAGDIRDTVRLFPAGRAITFNRGQPEITIFGREPAWTVLRDGRIATAVTDRYRMEFRDAAGRLVRILDWNHPAVAVSGRDRSLIRAALTRTIAGMGFGTADDAGRFAETIGIADHLPAFLRILPGPEQTLWVQRPKAPHDMPAADQSGWTLAMNPLDEDYESRVWDVFDWSGRWQRAVAVPAHVRLLWSDGERLYGVRTTPEGAQLGVRLRVGR